MELLQPAPPRPVVRGGGPRAARARRLRRRRPRHQPQVAVGLGEGALRGAKQARAQRVHLVEQVERLRERGRARAQHRARAAAREPEHRGRLRGVPAVAPRRAQRVRLVHDQRTPTRGAQSAPQPCRHLERDHHHPRPLSLATSVPRAPQRQPRRARAQRVVVIFASIVVVVVVVARALAGAVAGQGARLLLRPGLLLARLLPRLRHKPHVVQRERIRAPVDHDEVRGPELGQPSLGFARPGEAHGRRANHQHRAVAQEARRDGQRLDGLPDAHLVRYQAPPVPLEPETHAAFLERKQRVAKRARHAVQSVGSAARPASALGGGVFATATDRVTLERARCHGEERAGG